MISHPLLRRAYLSVQKRFFKTEQDLVFDRWFADKGDETLRLDYALAPDSIVFDLGGYRGEWARQIHDRYGCLVYVFEPAREFCHSIRAAFAGIAHVKVFDFGLGPREETVSLNLKGDGSSLFAQGSGSATAPRSDENETIRLRPFKAFCDEHAIERIDLLKINIEGAEFDLLEHILDSGLITRIGDIQVQFHDFVPNAHARREAIRRRLANTHRTTYDYPFVWENWRLRESGS